MDRFHETQSQMLALCGTEKGTHISVAKELLFRLTKNDFEIQTFRAGGKGGQHQNKTNSGVRIIHKASGARGEARDNKSYEQNKKNAFLRLTASKEFKNWHKLETARRLYGAQEIEKLVERGMQSKNLQIEVKDEKGKWVEE